MKNIPLAPKHTTMRVDVVGLFHEVREGNQIEAITAFLCREMLANIQEMAERFYSGDVAAVDEFLQLYCLDQERPEQ